MVRWVLVEHLSPELDEQLKLLLSSVNTLSYTEQMMAVRDFLQKNNLGLQDIGWGTPTEAAQKAIDADKSLIQSLSSSMNLSRIPASPNQHKHGIEHGFGAKT